MKKLATILAVTIIAVCMTTVSAHAGAARRHTIEGIMIGTGVAILGAAIYNGMDNSHHISAPAYQHRPPRRPHHRPHHRPQSWYGQQHGQSYGHHRPYGGRWEITRVWIEPVYESRWNPGHYNKRGRWVRGRYQQFRVSKGYYEERKVWVTH
ncbi:MAG: hypothetical protein GY729_11940 [Desulfobacteraceae bacterium]|nr:hypothetical protein [Desulfobacteraceae bacterium]